MKTLEVLSSVKTNFPEYYKTNFICDIFFISESNLQHLLDCSKLLGSNQLVTYIPNYKNIFDSENPEGSISLQGFEWLTLGKRKKITRK